MNTNPNNPSNVTEINSNTIDNQASTTNKSKQQDSFVKLAMRNMVKKGSTSLFHLALTVLGVVGVLLGLAIAFH